MAASTAPSAEPERPIRALLTTLGVVLAVVAVRQLAIDTEVDVPKFLDYAPNMLRIGSGVFNPDLSVLPMLGKYVRETIEIAVLGTLIGAALAIPVSFVMARNLMRRSAPTTGVLGGRNIRASLCANAASAGDSAPDCPMLRA